MLNPTGDLLQFNSAYKFTSDRCLNLFPLKRTCPFHQTRTIVNLIKIDDIISTFYNSLRKAHESIYNNDLCYNSMTCVTVRLTDEC